MARTPLLRQVQNLSRLYRIAARRGVTVQEILEARRDAGHAPLSRRTFLGTAAAAAAATALPRMARAKSDPTIAIVGGGIAGVTTAVRLADRGLAATVYEASGRIGGRMHSNTTYWDDGQVSEWCGELIDTGHKTIHDLAGRFGLTLDNVVQAQPKRAQDTYYFGGGYYPFDDAVRDFDAVFRAVRRDAREAGYPTRWDSYTSAGQALDQLSIYDWIESRVPGGHGSPMGQLLDVAYVIEYGGESTDQSSLNLVYLLAYQPDREGFAIFGESDEAFHIRGGNEQLPQVMADSLGDAVVKGHKLVRLRRLSDGRYRLTFERGSGTREETMDYVVLAIPFAVLAEVDTSKAGFDELKQRAIQELGRGHNGKLQLQTRSRFWNQPGPWPALSTGGTYSDTGYQATWDVTRAQEGDSGILVLYSGAGVTDSMRASRPFSTDSKPGVMRDALRGLGQLEPVLPGVSAAWNGKATQSLPHLSPLLRNAYCFYRVGQYTDFGGHEGTTQGGVLFAGEHCSQDFQGFMEGGASEGKRAAKELAATIQA